MVRFLLPLALLSTLPEMPEPKVPDMAQEVHAFIREQLAGRFGEPGRDVRIQYGGSVKPANAADLMSEPDIDGALVGGASLDAESFAKIVHSGEASA